jgi:1-aminocyclopropane-1-carboxylate deaminase
MLAYHDTPIQEIRDSLLKEAGVRLLIKREDLNHPFVSGNKWWKLKYNLEEAIQQGHKTLLTYGGAFSNHIVATAAAASEIGLKSIGIIRGEETLPLNDVLDFASKHGMQLHYLSREAYRQKSSADDYLKNFNDCYIIPEGGSNSLAVKGVSEFGKKLTLEYDYLCCAVGTGGTLAGLIEGIDVNKNIIGFPVLKDGRFLINEIKKLSVKSRHSSNWELIYDYHFSGYAKKTNQLLEFIENFKIQHRVPLEFVYTGKMMAGIYDLVNKRYFRSGSTILAIHSGGVSINPTI